MTKIYNPPKQQPSMRITGTLAGIGASALLFLAIPLTQIFSNYQKAPNEIQSIEIAPPPPPPPPVEPPTPPQSEEEEPPPELNTPPPPISLEQLEMALNPGTGGALGGDFALPTFEVSGQELGGIEIFDLSDVDKKPVPTKQIEPRSRGEKGTVVLLFNVTQYGKTSDIRIEQSTNPRLNQPCIEAIRRWEFIPGEKDGKSVITKVKQPINFK